MKIYMDFNATTPVLPEVSETVADAMQNAWGNPSSGHELGTKARGMLDKARMRIASLINAEPDEIVFTSGGTESNNLAIIGCVQARRHRGSHLVTTRIEHPSVLNPFLHLLEHGWKVDFASPDLTGIVAVDAVERLIRTDTVMVSVMLANNETGAIQPVKEIAGLCRQKGIIIHADAAQAVGKMPVDVRALGIDLMTIAGHKLYAPKGIGALFVRKGVEIDNILYGAGQERGIRPGTEPVPLACGLGMACKLMQEEGSHARDRIAGLRDKMYSIMKDMFPGMVRFVPPDMTLVNTLAVSFPGLEGAAILARAGDVMASTGAACHDRSVKVSHVLSAMGIDDTTAMGMIRLSLGIMTTGQEVSRAAESIAAAAMDLENERRGNGFH